MSSIHLTDAKKECQDNPSCEKFYHVCGRGSKFKFCTDASTESPSTCGAVLYKMDEIGNTNALCPHLHCRDITLLQYNSFNLILMYHFDSLDATTQMTMMPTTTSTAGNNAKRLKDQLSIISESYLITISKHCILQM